MPTTQKFRRVVFANNPDLTHLSDHDLDTTFCRLQCGWAHASATYVPFRREWVDPGWLDGTRYCPTCAKTALARFQW